MIGYVTLGTNDLARAAVFYDALAGELETPRMMDFDGFIAWGKPGGAAGIGLTKPFDGNPATVGNGVMIALEAKDKEQVRRGCMHSRLPMAEPAKDLRDRVAIPFMPVISATPTGIS